MKLAKDNKGISLASLAITILIMLIIAAVSINYGMNEMNFAKEQKLLSEIEIIRSAIYQTYNNYIKTKNESILVGTKVEQTEIQKLATEINITLVTIPESYNENERAYYRLSSSDLKNIGIEKAEDTYIVNYVTGEVINETKKVTSSGQVLYTYSRGIFNNIDVTAF